MAQIYNKKDLFEQAKKAIKENNLFFFSDVIAFLPCHTDTFYQYFRPESKEHSELRSMLEDNKIKTKSAIRAKLFKSQKAAELLALYRLICTPEEHRLLNQQYIEQTIKEQPLFNIDIEEDPKSKNDKQ
jgi:flagellar biosynthesis regulator FlbT